MRRLPIHVALVLTLLATIVPVVNAQTYLDYIFPLPAKTPKTEVGCTTCSVSDNKKTMVGYQGAISTFTGRYLDCAFDGEGFNLPRVLRAWQMKYDAAHDRLYMREGSNLVGYNLTNLISRVASNEALIKLDRPSDSGPAGRYLKWDKTFNIEDSWPQHAGDGGDWLPDFDIDDRGHVLVAGGQFWGLLTDDYGTGQAFDSGNAQPGNSYTEILSVKTSDGRYYAVVGDERSASTVFDVTTPPPPLPPSGIGPTPVRGLSFAWVKTAASKTADNHWVALIGTDLVLRIYTADALIAGRPATFATTVGHYTGVTTDGVNFYAVQAVGGHLTISVLSPSGGSFAEKQYPTSTAFTPERVQYGAGYLSMAGQSMVNGVSAQDIRLFRVGAGTMTELDLLAYRKNASAPEPYIVSCCSAAAPTGYIKPSYGLAFDSFVYKKSGKTYLIVNLKGLGDIYEIKGSDSITAANKGIIGTPNPNSGQTGSGPYYGDKVLFGSSTSATAPMNVVWDFGNPESTDNTNTTTTGTDVTHQYSGVTATSQLSGARTVTVTNASDSSINDVLPINLAVPTARVAIVGQSTTAAIVTSDLWKDASDGTVEGHYSSWNIDGTVTKTLPSATVPVGDCSAHTLNFTANYGPYTGSGSSLAPVNGTLALSLAAIAYTPKPFIALVNAPTSNGNNVTFTSGSRVTTDTAIVPTATSFTWQWDLLDGATSLQTATGTSTFSQIPSFVVPSSTFTGKTGLKARLQLSTTATLPGTCANATSSSGTVDVPNAPDPQISVVTGCQYASSPCTYKVTSKTGADTSAWNVSWSFNPSNVSGGTGLTFSPVFSASYSGTLTASVTNAIGSGSDTTAVSIATAICNPTLPTQGDIAIQYFGTSGTCGIGTNCSVNEKITFAASGYKFNVNCDTYNWDFGDGASATTLRATHSYTGNNQTYHGKFTVTVSSTNGSVTLQYPFTVAIGTTGGGCTVNCNPTCPQITSQSAFIYFAGSSGCSYVSTVPCQPGELVSMQVTPYLGSGYNFSCGTHSFSWSFGDGSSGSGQLVSHSYQSGGTYPVTVTVTSPTGQMQFPVTVTVAGGAVCVAPSASNTAITLSGGTSGCTATNNNCRVGENIGLNVTGLNGFSFAACNVNTFTWDFGDGSQGATGQSVSHVYPGTQPQYTAHVTVTNELGSTTLSQLVKVSTGSCPAPTATNAFLTYSGPTSNCSYLSPEVPCGANEVIAFSANADSSTGYRFSCGTHTFLWTFDDGSTSTDRVPTHAFVQNRTYHVTCAITNGSGTVTLPLSIAVGSGDRPPIEVGFAYEPVQGNPTLIKFTPSVTPANTVSSWKWDFGDNTDPVTISGTSTVPQYHPYASTGTYTVTLTTNAGSVTKQIVVGTPPPPRPRPGRH